MFVNERTAESATAQARQAILVGTYDTHAAAMAVVRRSTSDFGPSSIDSLVLTEETGDGADPRVVATGSDLMTLADAHVAPIGGGV